VGVHAARGAELDLVVTAVALIEAAVIPVVETVGRTPEVI